MTAFHPKADLCGANSDVRLGQKQTFALQNQMSALPQQRTSAILG